MKRWISALPEVFLAASAVCLLALAVVPARRTASAPRPERQAAVNAAMPAATPSAPAPADPDAIVSLFYREPPRGTQAPTVAPAEGKPAAAAPVKPMEVAWLSYIGYFSGADGKPFFYIKDSRSGRLIRITTGEATDWTLVEAAEDRIVVRHDGTVYAVARKR
jgi:hypothetical protein